MDTLEYIKEAHEHQKSKVCNKPKCKQHNPQPLSEFYKNVDAKDGLQYQCKSCRKEYNDNQCRFKRWFITKRSRRGSWEFTIEPNDIPGVKIEWYNLGVWGSKNTWRGIKYPKVCSKWGIELDWGMNGRQYNSPSLDRINPKLGYIKGNVRLVCDSYNMAKSNCPPDEWDVIEKQIARAILFENKA